MPEPQARPLSEDSIEFNTTVPSTVYQSR